RERPDLLPRVAREEEFGLIDAAGPEPPAIGTDRDLPRGGPLTAEAHPERGGLEVERGQLREDGGLEPGYRLVPPRGEVRCARGQPGPQPVHPPHEPALVRAHARESVEVGLEPPTQGENGLDAVSIPPLEAGDLVHAPLDGFEPGLIEHDAVPVTAERPRRL